MHIFRQVRCCNRKREKTPAAGIQVDSASQIHPDLRLFVDTKCDQFSSNKQGKFADTSWRKSSPKRDRKKLPASGTRNILKIFWHWQLCCTTSLWCLYIFLNVSLVIFPLSAWIERRAEQQRVLFFTIGPKSILLTFLSDTILLEGPVQVPPCETLAAVSSPYALSCCSASSRFPHFFGGVGYPRRWNHGLGRSRLGSEHSLWLQLQGVRLQASGWFWQIWFKTHGSGESCAK